MSNKRVTLNMRHITHITQYERVYGNGAKEWEYTFILVGGTIETFKTQNREDVDYIEALMNDVIFNKLEIPPPTREEEETVPYLGRKFHITCSHCHQGLGENSKCMNCLIAREIKL